MSIYGMNSLSVVISLFFFLLVAIVFMFQRYKNPGGVAIYDNIRQTFPIVLSSFPFQQFQHLDVDFFKTLKAAYHRQMNEYQLGSSLRGVAKGMFCGWH